MYNMCTASRWQGTEGQQLFTEPQGANQRTVPWAPNRMLCPTPPGRSYGVGMALPECQDPIMLAPLYRWELESRRGAWCSTWSRAQLRHLEFVIPPKQKFPKCGPRTSSTNISGELVIECRLQGLATPGLPGQKLWAWIHT